MVGFVKGTPSESVDIIFSFVVWVAKEEVTSQGHADQYAFDEDDGIEIGWGKMSSSVIG